MPLEANKYLYDARHARRIIAFRNILIHGYADVDDLLVWDVVVSKLPVLLQEIDALLNN